MKWNSSLSTVYLSSLNLLLLSHFLNNTPIILFLASEEVYFFAEFIRQKDQRPHGFRGEVIRSPATRNLPDVGIYHVDAPVHGMAQFLGVRQQSVAVN